jgi:hypothetical protein
MMKKISTSKLAEWISQTHSALERGDVPPLPDVKFFSGLCQELLNEKVELTLEWGNGGLDTIVVSFRQWVRILRGGKYSKILRTYAEGDRVRLHFCFNFPEREELEVTYNGEGEVYRGDIDGLYIEGPKLEDTDIAQLLLRLSTQPLARIRSWIEKTNSLISVGQVAGTPTKEEFEAMLPGLTDRPVELSMDTESFGWIEAEMAFSDWLAAVQGKSLEISGQPASNSGHPILWRFNGATSSSSELEVVIAESPVVAGGLDLIHRVIGPEVDGSDLGELALYAQKPWYEPSQALKLRTKRREERDNTAAQTLLDHIKAGTVVDGEVAGPLKYENGGVSAIVEYNHVELPRKGIWRDWLTRIEEETYLPIGWVTRTVHRPGLGALPSGVEYDSPEMWEIVWTFADELKKREEAGTEVRDDYWHFSCKMKKE